MENFESAYTALMDMVNRPMSDTIVLNGAKREINNAIRLLQRNHAYNYTERLVRFPYGVSTLHTDLGDICGGTIRDFISVQQGANENSTVGRPIKLITYSQLQTERMRRTRRGTETDYLADLTLEEPYVTDKVAFITGSNLGLSPMPSSVTYVIVNVHIWLPSMIESSNTNFFLTIAFDLVLMLALKRMHIYLKTDSRFAVSEQEVADGITSLMTWDSQVTQFSHTVK